MEGAQELFNKVAEELGKELDWHLDLQERFEPHPAVLLAVEKFTCSCINRLVREWPHQAEMDRARLAYTQGDEKGRRNLQTVTTLGRYLTRHFPEMPQTEITGAVQRYTATGCRIVRTIEEIVGAVQNGPGSCMQFDDDDELIRTGGHHPYECYDPDLGWACAIRVDEGGQINARALVYEQDGHKCFVRSYQRCSGYSGPDPELVAWLEGQGYTHESAWPDGTKLARIEVDRGLVAPYIDGGRQCLDDDGDSLVIRLRGRYHATNTSGLLENCNYEECECCGQGFYEDDMTWVGRHEDTRVCQGCLDGCYIYVEASRGAEYYVLSDDAIEISGTYYDRDNLPSCIVELHDGDYAHEDDVVRCETDDEYYLSNDDDLVWVYGDAYLYGDDTIVELKSGEYVLREDAWQCYETEDWYSYSDVSPVEVDGHEYHPDHAPETEEDYDKPEGSIPNELQQPLPLTVSEAETV